MKSRKFDFANAIDEQSSSFYAKNNPTRPENGIPNAIEVNLKTGAMVSIKIPDKIMDAYVGGRALATRLFAEYANGDQSEANPMILASAPMNNTLTPYSDNITIAFQSPVTTRFTVFTSICRVGTCMRTLGLDAIILLDSSPDTVTVNISSSPSIRLEANLSGMTTSELDKHLRGSEQQSIITTGPAADNGATFAAPVCDAQTLGRGGLGLLMMKKNIKAMIFTPDESKLRAPLQTIVSLKPARKEPALDRIAKLVSQSRYLGKTEFNMMDKGSHAGFVPVCNFRYRTDPRLFYLLSKKDVIKSLYKRRIVDTPLLSHIAEEFPYSQLSMLGSNLACFDISKIRNWITECVELGLDPVSAGNVIGWAIDERKHGKLEGYPELDDLSNKTVLRIINRLANPRGRKLYGLLALGAKATIESKEFDTERLFQIAGLECGPFDYRGYRSMAIEDYYGYCLTCPGEPFIPLYEEKPRRLAKYIVWNNNLAEGLESAGFSHLLLGPVMCERDSVGISLAYFFPSAILPVFSPMVLSRRFFEATGKRIRRNSFRDLGRSCYLLETGINKVISSAEPQMPSFFMTDPSSAAPKPQIVEFTKLVECYEKERLTQNFR